MLREMVWPAQVRITKEVADRTWDWMLCSSHCGTLTLTPVLRPPLPSLGKYLAFSQAPGPQCSFLSNRPLRPVYLTWLQRVACTLSHNPSSLAKWVPLLSLDVPKTLACLSHQLFLIHNGPIQILALATSPPGPS